MKAGALNVAPAAVAALHAPLRQRAAPIQARIGEIGAHLANEHRAEREMVDLPPAWEDIVSGLVAGVRRQAEGFVDHVLDHGNRIGYSNLQFATIEPWRMSFGGQAFPEPSNEFLAYIFVPHLDRMQADLLAREPGSRGLCGPPRVEREQALAEIRSRIAALTDERDQLQRELDSLAFQPAA